MIFAVAWIRFLLSAVASFNAPRLPAYRRLIRATSASLPSGLPGMVAFSISTMAQRQRFEARPMLRARLGNEPHCQHHHGA
jgi:hypothetical protein